MINKSLDCEQDNHEHKKYKNDSNDMNTNCSVVNSNLNDFINDVEMESANNGNGHFANGKFKDSLHQQYSSFIFQNF